MPSVEQELMRVARAPVAGAPGWIRARRARRTRRPGAALAAAVSVVALMIGAGFLIALRGAGAGVPTPATLGPAPSRGLFPGAPHSQRLDIGSEGDRCRRAPRNRYLPRQVGCVTVLLTRAVPGDRFDMVMLYARLGRRTPAGYAPGRFTIELVRPSGAITRTRLPATDVPPTWLRGRNLNRVPGQELTLHLDDISSGDTYAVVTFAGGRPLLVHPLLSAGGDSVFREGFACRPGPHPRVISRTMVLMRSQPVDGRWRWTVKTYVWHGSALRQSGRHTFVRRGQPGRSAMAHGMGCGRRIGIGGG